MKSIFSVLILLLTITSCNRPVLFDNTREIKEPWNSINKQSFVVEITDTITPFNFLIQVRNDVDFNYSNIFLFMKTFFPDGRYAIDTINIWLADPDGKWTGKGFGKFRDTEILFKQNGRFPMKGQYRFEFEQAMRELELNGIKSIGIRIEYGEK